MTGVAFSPMRRCSAAKISADCAFLFLGTARVSVSGNGARSSSGSSLCHRLTELNHESFAAWGMEGSSGTVPLAIVAMRRAFARSVLIQFVPRGAAGIVTGMVQSTSPVASPTRRRKNCEKVNGLPRCHWNTPSENFVSGFGKWQQVSVRRA
jgi:hypothetical protein